MPNSTFRKLFFVLLGAVISAFLVAGPVGSETTGENPLAPFDRLVGGEWTAGEAFHVFEWGVGKQCVRARSYRRGEDEPVLVSEGMWFWHPGTQSIRGYGVAIGMGVDLFDYTAHFEEDVLVTKLVSYGAYGGNYEERWKFSGPDTYEWTLYQEVDGKLQKFMSEQFERTP